MPCFTLRQILLAGVYSLKPVLGLRNSTPFVRIFVKLNICAIELAIPSNDPWPIRVPPSQLSSTKRMIELWSVRVWSTKFARAQGEITSKGNLGPYPQRPTACVFAGFRPGRAVAPDPHAPAP
jgi:hypothetical protein